MLDQLSRTEEAHVAETSHTPQTMAAATQPSKPIHPKGLHNISIAEAVELDRKLSGDTYTIIENPEPRKFLFQRTLGDGTSPDWLQAFMMKNQKQVGAYISEEQGRIAFNPDDGKYYLMQELRHPEDKAIEAALIRCGVHAFRRDTGRKKPQSIKTLWRLYIALFNWVDSYRVDKWQRGRIDRQRKALAGLILDVPATTLADARVKSRIAAYAAIKDDFPAWACVERVSKDFEKLIQAGHPGRANLRRAA